MKAETFTKKFIELNRAQNDYAALTHICSLLQDLKYEYSILGIYQEDISSCTALLESIRNSVRPEALNIAAKTLRIA